MPTADPPPAFPGAGLPPLPRPPEPRRPSRGRRLAEWAAVLLACAGVAAGAGFAARFGAFPETRGGAFDAGAWRVLAVGLALMLGEPAAVFLHELGHVAGARAAGFRVWRFAVGPLVGRRTGDRGAGPWRWAWEPARPFWTGRRHGWSGQVQALPAGDDDLRRRTAWVVAGGPLANAAAAVVAAAATFALWERGGEAWTTAAWCAGALAAQNALVAVGTLLPRRRGGPDGLSTDGTQLWRLARGGRAADRALALARLGAAAAAGVPPGEWPADLIADAAPDPALAPAKYAAADGAAVRLAFAAAAARGAYPAAGAALAKVIGGWHVVSAADRPHIAAAADWFERHVRGDAAAAAWWAARSAPAET